jgi:RNA polymerase sigma-70 factor (ECF subfamily)
MAVDMGAGLAAGTVVAATTRARAHIRPPTTLARFASLARVTPSFVRLRSISAIQPHELEDQQGQEADPAQMAPRNIVDGEWQPVQRERPQDLAVADDEFDDVRLLAEIAAGRERAFALFMARHLDRIHGLALRYTNNRADAEDIAQETFLRIWRSADRYEVQTGAKPAAWLSRIALNLCHDHARRQKLRRWLPFRHEQGDNGDGPVFEPADPAPGADRQVEDRVEIGALRADIAQLPDKQRKALLLTTVAGHSNAEAASILKTSIGAVEQAIFRARKTLRQQRDARDGHN